MSSTTSYVRDTDPFLEYQFSVNISYKNGAKEIHGYFDSIKGMDNEYKVIEHRVIDCRILRQAIPVNIIVPGFGTTGKITMRKGITATTEMWEWINLMGEMKPNDVRADIEIKMYDRNYQEQTVWMIGGAFPVNISGPEFDASSNNYAVEEVTVVFETIQRVPSDFSQASSAFSIITGI